MRVPHSEDFPVIIGSIILCNSLISVIFGVQGGKLKLEWGGYLKIAVLTYNHLNKS
jgi:hypothetical protein